MAAVRYTSRLEWKGPRVVRAAARGGAAGVNMALERLRALSVPRAPIDTGALRNAANILDATETSDEIGGFLVFDTPYAAAQHERLDYQHDDGQAKYVEEPMLQHEAELLGLIARGMQHGIPRA